MFLAQMVVLVVVAKILLEQVPQRKVLVEPLITDQRVVLDRLHLHRAVAVDWARLEIQMAMVLVVMV
jgi:hypothetical protein